MKPTSNHTKTVLCVLPAALLLAHCSSGANGDQLFLGTIAGAQKASGIISVVVHADSSSSGGGLLGNGGGSTKAVEAKITTSGGSTGGTSVTCSGAAAAPPMKTCPQAGQTACGTQYCCDSAHPFLCASTQSCYATAEAAAAACSSSCSSCDGKAHTVTTGGTGASQIVKGTMDGSGRVTMSGGGWQLDGKVENGGISGDYTGPKGSGNFAGVDATNDSVTRFCGTFSGADSGTWNLQTSSSKATGSFAGSFASGNLDGSVSGSSVSLRYSSPSASGTASGTISGSSVSGTYSGDASGTWSGGACNVGSGSAPKSAKDCCTQTSRGLMCPIEGC
jgi:hypothetical protein